MYNNELINEIQKKCISDTVPFPDVAIKNTLPLHLVEEIEKDFISFKKFDEGDPNFRYGTCKYSCRNRTIMPKSIVDVINFFYSKNFLVFLEKNFKLTNLIPDWNLWGAGMHNNVRGNFLKVHSDFIYQRGKNTRRVLNLLFYVNSNWKDEWGGHIELWDKKMNNKVKSLLPLINNTLIFRTDKDSNHGFPDKLLCPSNVSRKSIALYYFVEEKRLFPINIKKRKYYTTVWKKRPGIDEPEFMDQDNLWRKIKYKFLPRIFLKR